jgi:hypothetical protein
MPRYPGLKTIAPLTFAYFDPAKREYVRLRSPQIELNVEQGAAAAAPIISGAGREDVRLLSQDIRFIKVATPSFSRKGQYLHTGTLFLVLLVLPLAGLAGTLVFAKNRRAVVADEVGYRHRRAIKVARRGLQEAEFLLNIKKGAKDGPAANQKLRFYTEVSKALWKYLGDKLNTPQAEVSVDSTVSELQRRGVDKGILSALRVLLESCDLARFSPASLDVAHMQKVYDEARRIIVELERMLK